MESMPRMRRWTDPRDRSRWQVIYAPGVELDTPAVRHAREGLIFRGDAGDFHAPSPYGWDLESLSESDLQGLLDQARELHEQVHRTAGWGLPAEEDADTDDEDAREEREK